MSNGQIQNTYVKLVYADDSNGTITDGRTSGSGDGKVTFHEKSPVGALPVS